MQNTSDICDQVLIALRRITRAIDLHSKKLVQKYGLTGPQMLVLKELIRMGDVPINIISRNVNLSQATVTSILDRLEKRDYMTRVRSSEDKRKVFARVTEKGHEIFKNAPPLLQESFIREFDKLKDWEQSQLLSTLQRIGAMMDADQIDASPILTGGEENLGQSL